MKLKTNKRRVLYITAIITFTVGMCVSALLFVKMWNNFSTIDKSFIRILVPGNRTIFLPSPGNYTIFFEFKSSMGGKVYSAPQDALNGLNLSIEEVDTGASISIKAAQANSTYSFFGREGRAILSFYIEKPGWYKISSDLERSQWAGQHVLAISQGFTKSIFISIGLTFAFIAIILLTIVATTILIVIGATVKKVLPVT